jgi:hypothetical protein
MPTTRRLISERNGGEDYTSSVRSLWERCVQAYKNDDAAPEAVDELLMCFAYDVVLGPYLGVPEPHKLAFLHWLIDGIRRGLRRSVE